MTTKEDVLSYLDQIEIFVEKVEPFFGDELVQTKVFIQVLRDGLKISKKNFEHLKQFITRESDDTMFFFQELPNMNEKEISFLLDKFNEAVIDNQSFKDKVTNSVLNTFDELSMDFDDVYDPELFEEDMEDLAVEVCFLTNAIADIYIFNQKDPALWNFDTIQPADVKKLNFKIPDELLNYFFSNVNQ